MQVDIQVKITVSDVVNFAGRAIGYEWGIQIPVRAETEAGARAVRWPIYIKIRVKLYRPQAAPVTSQKRSG